MLKSIADTIHYFHSPRDYFWRWTENGQVIEWASGATICYRDDLAGILEELPVGRLPSLSSLLLLLYACKDRMSFQEEFFLTRTLKRFEDRPKEVETLFDNSIRFMHIINELPTELKSGKNRVHLIYEIFGKPGFVVLNVQLRNAIDELRSGRLDEQVIITGNPVSLSGFKYDLQPLSDALQKYPTTESLELKLRTGLEAIPKPAPVIMPDSSPGDLFDQMAQDPKTVGISRLAKRLVAVLNIPMHSQGSGDQSYGGISDITNRGNYDKLLLSELANENDLLMARLVNNEALYFRREEPPENPKRERTILIDTTLRMWGIPRVFALSAALAFARSAKHGELTKAYTLAGDSYNEVNLDTREGIIKALEELHYSLHCGKALGSFVSDFPPLENNEYIFITDEKLINSVEFYAFLSLVKEQLGFIITVSRNGDIQFFECIKGKSKLLSHAKLDLEDLLFAPATIPPLIKEDDRKPIFLSQSPNPLLYPKARIKLAAGKLCRVGALGIVAVTETQRVLYIPQKLKGAYELLTLIEKGIYTFGWTDREFHIVVNNYQRKFLKIYSIDRTAFTIRSTNLSDGVQFAREIFYHKDEFYIRTDHASFLVSSFSHEVLEKKGVNEHSLFFHSLRSQSSTKADLEIMSQYIHGYYSVMFKVRELYVSESRKLVLGNYNLNLVLNDHDIKISENTLLQTPVKQATELKMSRDILRNRNIKFSIRKWQDGSEAIIDSRGLLHLKSSDSSVPEITIVLITGANTACWTTDGTVCGSDYFIDENRSTTIPASEFYKKYIQRFIDKIMES